MKYTRIKNTFYDKYTHILFSVQNNADDKFSSYRKNFKLRTKEYASPSVRMFELFNRIR
jgi:hypothetical protein